MEEKNVKDEMSILMNEAFKNKRKLILELYKDVENQKRVAREIRASVDSLMSDNSNESIKKTLRTVCNQCLTLSESTTKLSTIALAMIMFDDFDLNIQKIRTKLSNKTL